MPDEPKFKILSGGVPLPIEDPEPAPNPNLPVELLRDVLWYPAKLRLEIQLQRVGGGDRSSAEFMYESTANEMLPFMVSMIEDFGKEGILAADLSEARRALLAADSKYGLACGKSGSAGLRLYRLRETKRWEPIMEFSAGLSDGAKLAAAFALHLAGGTVASGPAPGTFSIVAAPGLPQRRKAGAIFTQKPTVIRGELPGALLADQGLLIYRIGKGASTAGAAA